MTHIYKNRMKITQYGMSMLHVLFCFLLLFGWTAWAFAGDEEFPWILFYPAITGVKRAVPVKRPPPTEAAWRLIATNALFEHFPPGIWAAADDDAFASGANGNVYHYDGTRWTPMEVSNFYIHYIWGFGSDDVYAVGDGVHYYDGNNWTLMPGSPNGWSIWGTGPDDLFVPSNGGVSHFDGSTWTTTVIPGSFTLWEIWGAASDDVFVVGNKGKIYHYNGTDWSPMNSGTISNIWEVWGAATNNIYALTYKAVLHYDGTSWSPIPINIDPDDSFNSIWGSSADNIYISTGKALLHYNGTDWQQVATTSASNIWGSTNKVFLASYEIGVYESNSYKTHFFQSQERILTVSGSAANNVLLGGMWTYGLLYNGQESQFLYPTYGQHPNFHFYFAWVIDEKNILAGDDDEFKYYDGTDWWSYKGNFQDAWAQSATEGFVVGGYGGVYQFSKAYGLTGGMDTPTSEDLHGVWGSTNDNVYAVGNGGTILHFDGSDWLEVNNPATQNLNAVWGNGPQDIYAVGNSGSIVHYDGTDWSITAAGQFSMLFRDICGFAHDNIYVAGSEGLVHYDGNGWSILDTGYNLDLEAVWGSDPGNIYLVDHQGNVYRYSK